MADNKEQHTDPEHIKLMQYLSGEMSAEEQHEFEKRSSEDEFTDDAVEGLISMNNQKALSLANQLNVDLKRQLKTRKKKKSNANPQSYLYFAIIILLLLIAVSFFVIKRAL